MFFKKKKSKNHFLYPVPTSCILYRVSCILNLCIPYPVACISWMVCILYPISLIFFILYHVSCMCVLYHMHCNIHILKLVSCFLRSASHVSCTLSCILYYTSYVYILYPISFSLYPKFDILYHTLYWQKGIINLNYALIHIMFCANPFESQA